MSTLRLTALGTDKPLAPIGNGGLGAVALSHFGGVGLDLVAARLAPHNQRCETGESAARANELALAGDDDGAATWRRIMAAVTQLANTTPPGPLH
jgi:hypothetical protein